MIKPLENLDQLAATQRRPRRAGPIAGVKWDHRPLGNSLSIKPADLDGTLNTLGTIAAALPQDALTPAQRMAFRKLAVPSVGTILRSFGQGIQRAQAMVPGGVPGAPAPQALTAQADRLASYVAFKRNAQRGLSSLLDLRLLIGAWQFYLLKTLLKAVVAKLEDPEVSDDEKDTLGDAFAGLLLHKEQILLDTEDTKAASAEQRAQQGAEAAHAQKYLEMMDVMQAVRAGRQVDPVALAEAAVFFHQEQQAAQASAAQATQQTATQAAAAPDTGDTGARKLKR